MSKFFHGVISRVEAEDLLRKSGKHRSYLVRESEKSRGDISISFRYAYLVEAPSLVSLVLIVRQRGRCCQAFPNRTGWPILQVWSTSVPFAGAHNLPIHGGAHFRQFDPSGPSSSSALLRQPCLCWPAIHSLLVFGASVGEARTGACVCRTDSSSTCRQVYTWGATGIISDQGPSDSGRGLARGSACARSDACRSIQPQAAKFAGCDRCGGCCSICWSVCCRHDQRGRRLGGAR
jgi:hypothetical protein